MAENYMELFRGYVDEIVIRDHGEFMIVIPPIYFPFTPDSISLRVQKVDDGYILGDCHRIEDYWEECELDIEKYSERIERICKKFDIYRDERSFCTRIQSDCPERTRREIGMFLQAMVLLGNIYI